MPSAMELIAVILAIAYLLLAIRQNIWCWLAALISTSIYLIIFIDVNLYMEALLQVFYIIMAIYGYLTWRGSGKPDDQLPVTTWPLKYHLIAIGIILLLTLASGYSFSTYTDAALPYLDAFTTFSAMFATWLVAQKKIENWLYWVVIDALSIYLYMSKDLYVTSGLFAFYIIMCAFGYRAWRRSMLTHETA